MICIVHVDAPADCDLECPTPPAKKIKKSAIEQLLGDVHIVSATPGKTIAQRVKSKLENFKKQSSIPLNANPLLWWKTNESHPSLLARLAKNLLGIHQPVCQVKGIQHSHIVTATRSALSAKHVERLIFLKKNL